MIRMIEELYFGNIDPNSKMFIKDSRYGKAMKIMQVGKPVCISFNKMC